MKPDHETEQLVSPGRRRVNLASLVELLKDLFSRCALNAKEALPSASRVSVLVRD